MRAVMDSGKYLCITISKTKRRNLDGYEKITTCTSCSYGDPEFPRSQLQLQHVHIHLDLDWERYSLLITSENITHTSILWFPQTRILIFTPEVFGRHYTGAPGVKRCSFLFCAFDRINQKHPIICGEKSPPHNAINPTSRGQSLMLQLLEDNIASKCQKKFINDFAYQITIPQYSTS